MIHFVTWIPLPYQQTLCRALNGHYRSELLVWFGETNNNQYPYQHGLTEGFSSRYLDREGYWEFFKALLGDKNAIVILGGWRSPMTIRTLFITSLLRVPVFIWADHPWPRRRNFINRAVRTSYLSVVNKIADGFLACGQPTLEHLRSLGLNHNKLVLFPYWTDVPENWTFPAHTQEEAISNKQPLKLISVGRLFPIKQFAVAIEAISIANKRAGRQLAELLIAGEGPERPALEQRAAELNSSNCVTFLGWLEPHEIIRQIENADMLLIPSLFEGYGVAVLEAMAAGRPVLASENVMAAIDRNERNGGVMLHRVGDAQQIAEQITWFAADHQKLRNASIAARRTAERWPPSRATEILDKVLVKTAAGRRLVSEVRSKPLTSFPERSVGVRVWPTT